MVTSFKMKKTIFLFILLLPLICFAEGLSNYLILNDIGPYKYRPKPTKRIYGNSGPLISTGHFYLDHDDVTYQTRYIQPEPLLGVEVQVTQHAGTDSDRWLLHEVERGFRDSDNLEAKPAEDTMLRELNGNRIFFYGGGVVGYRWISNNVVINIQYTNLGGPKPEPLEVIQAYLQKFPSTIPSTLVLDRAHDEQWIKDEMERRLWLCDKWFAQLESDRSKLSTVLKTIADHIVVFLNYREKYYGISGEGDKLALMGYLTAKDEASIKNRLAGYKAWWNANKTKTINLP